MPADPDRRPPEPVEGPPTQAPAPVEGPPAQAPEPVEGSPTGRPQAQPSERPRLPSLLLAGAVGALAATIAVAAFGFFVAFEQQHWSPGHIGMRLAQLLGIALAWALAIDLPVSLLRERAGWHRYLCLVLEAVLVVPVAALVLALAGALSTDALVVVSAIALVPVLLLAGVSMLAARRR
ncbi:MAG: hypothetical protein GXX90_01850 [Microbacteriaceae bacterium]|nr:hypothetical protein [Microbacteriaceae bacterium]